jgi:hypothetical protein
MDAGIDVALKLVGFEKETALIAEQFRLDNQNIRNFRHSNIHSQRLHPVQRPYPSSIYFTVITSFVLFAPSASFPNP